MFTVWASNNGAVLTSHKISNNRLISLEMSDPALTGKLDFGFVLFLN
jgi:hypothetical protein